jgi:hypothetical protein
MGPSQDPQRRSALVINTIYPDGSSHTDFRPYSVQDDKLFWEHADRWTEETNNLGQFVLRPSGKKLIAV